MPVSGRQRIPVRRRSAWLFMEKRFSAFEPGELPCTEEQALEESARCRNGSTRWCRKGCPAGNGCTDFAAGSCAAGVDRAAAAPASLWGKRPWQTAAAAPKRQRPERRKSPDPAGRMRDGAGSGTASGASWGAAPACGDSGGTKPGSGSACETDWLLHENDKILISGAFPLVIFHGNWYNHPGSV